MERLDCCFDTVLLAHAGCDTLCSYFCFIAAAHLDGMEKIVDGKLAVRYRCWPSAGSGDDTAPEWLTVVVSYGRKTV